MAKLYAPILESNIPAFYKDGNSIKITLPFIKNRAVSPVQVRGMAIKIKSIQSTGTLFEVKRFFNDNILPEDSNFVLTITDTQQINKLYPTNSYKFQIAYIDQDDNVGYYSNVGVGKYTTKPTVTIANLSNSSKNDYVYTFTGIYNQFNKDIGEKVSQYKFEIFEIINNKPELVYTTNYLIHNFSSDIENYESFDNFNTSFALKDEKDYTIKYTIKTINNMEISSPSYPIKKAKEIETSDVNLSISAFGNYEEGYTNLKIENSRNPKILFGKLILSRTDSNSDMQIWQILKEIPYKNAVVPQIQEYNDFTTVQGVQYKYSIQWINNSNQYTTTKYSDIVYSDFEDMFLYDGRQQLKIKFNPKINTFKINKQEQKVETLGSQFPFFLKNGNTNYKEFPISGFISYYMDENELFTPAKSLYPIGYGNIEELKTANFASYNIAAERNFKIKVLEWLTNGEPKLFRSPTEGNYIVQLLNVSLTPNDSVGRMLHSFSCSAYECCEFNQENCQKYLKEA